MLPLLVFACSSETVTRPPSPPIGKLVEAKVVVDAGRIAASERERGVTGVYVKALASPGFAELGKLLDDDAHFAFAGYKDVKGRDNVVKAHETLLGAYDERKIFATRVFLTDATQAIEWTLVGTHRPTHKPVIFKGLTLLWTRDDGSISNVHVYFDEAVVQAQLGTGPKALATLAPPPIPSGEHETIEQANSADEMSNLAPVHTALGALESGDENGYLATMSDDVEVTTLELSRKGKAEARNYFRDRRKSIGNLDTSIDNIWGIGNYVVVEYHVVGEQRGPIGWVPAQKDTLIKMFTVDVMEIQNAKIARIWRYSNPSQIVSTP